LFEPHNKTHTLLVLSELQIKSRLTSTCHCIFSQLLSIAALLQE